MGSPVKPGRFSLKLPLELWKRASKQAIEEQKSLQVIIAEALEDYLTERGA